MSNLKKNDRPISKNEDENVILTLNSLNWIKLDMTCNNRLAYLIMWILISQYKPEYMYGYFKL